MIFDTSAPGPVIWYRKIHRLGRLEYCTSYEGIVRRYQLGTEVEGWWDLLVALQIALSHFLSSLLLSLSLSLFPCLSKQPCGTVPGSVVSAPELGLQSYLVSCSTQSRSYNIDMEALASQGIELRPLEEVEQGQGQGGSVSPRSGEIEERQTDSLCDMVLPIFATSIFYTFERETVLPILPIFVSSYTSSTSAIGVAVAAYSAGRVVGGLPAGSFNGRYGSKATLMLSCSLGKALHRR